MAPYPLIWWGVGWAEAEPEPENKRHGKSTGGGRKERGKWDCLGEMGE